MIKVSHLCKNFGIAKNTVHVLRDINLEIEIGERIGIVGASGTGKTT